MVYLALNCLSFGIFADVNFCGSTVLKETFTHSLQKRRKLDWKNFQKAKWKFAKCNIEQMDTQHLVYSVLLSNYRYSSA